MTSLYVITFKSYNVFYKFMKNTLAKLWPALVLISSGLMYAIALKYFVFPAKVILTGLEGISSSLSYYFESTSLFLVLYLAFQLVLFAFAWLKLSRDFAIRTLLVIITVVIFLPLLPELHIAQPEPQNERILLVLFGGILSGTGKALAFRSHGSTGDEDIIGAYFASKYLKPVGSIAVLSAVVSTTFGLVLELLKTQDLNAVLNTLMYTCIYIFASVEMLNNLYQKFALSMLVVITNKASDIGQGIRELYPHRTFILQDGVGGHSGEKFHMLRTIVTNEEMPQIIDMIEEIDHNIFYFHHTIKDVSQTYYISPIGKRK